MPFVTQRAKYTLSKNFTPLIVMETKGFLWMPASGRNMFLVSRVLIFFMEFQCKHFSTLPCAALRSFLVKKAS